MKVTRTGADPETDDGSPTGRMGIVAPGSDSPSGSGEKSSTRAADLEELDSLSHSHRCLRP